MVSSLNTRSPHWQNGGLIATPVTVSTPRGRSTRSADSVAAATPEHPKPYAGRFGEDRGWVDGVGIDYVVGADDFGLHGAQR